MIDVSEGIVFGLKAEVVGPIGVDGDVQRRLGIHQDRGALRVEEVSFQYIAEGMSPNVARDKGTKLQATSFQGIRHVLNLTGAVPVASLRGPVEAVLGIVVGTQTLPRYVIAVHVLALRVREIEPCLLQPFEADRVLPLMMRKARIHSRFRWNTLAEPSGDDLRAGTTIDCHHSFIFIEPEFVKVSSL